MKRKESVLTSEVRTSFTGFDIHSCVQVCVCCASSYEGKNTLALFAATMGRNSENRRLLMFCSLGKIIHKHLFVFSRWIGKQRHSDSERISG